MKLETASKIKFIVNDPGFRDIEYYVTDRVQGLYKSLLQAKDMNEVAELRGRIFEVQRLLTLRDEVLSMEEDK